MPFKDRLLEAMARLGINQSELARRLGVESQAVNQWTRGKTIPRGQRFERLAEVLGVPPSTLLDEQPTSIALPAEHHPRSVQVLELDVRAQGGAGLDDAPLSADGSHAVVGHWTIPADYLQAHVAAPSAVRVIRVSGDSMEPQYAAGDRVLVDTSHRTPSPPGVYVVWDGFGLVLKHIEIVIGRTPPTARLSSENPAYSAYEVLLVDLQVQGKVIGKWVWK